MARIKFWEAPEELRVLDRILLALYKTDSFTLEVGPLNNKVFGDSLEKKFLKSFKGEEVDMSKELLADNIMASSLYYLSEEKLITINNPTIHLRHAGMMKIVQGGFAKEYQRSEQNTYYQRMFWFVALISLLFSVIAFMITL